MSSSMLAQLAALGTAFCWSFTSIFFTIGSQRVGPSVVNRARLLAAVLLVGIAHLIGFGTPFPLGVSLDRFFWLALSAVIGLIIGDSLLFHSYLLVGSRIGSLLLALAPIFGVALAWIFLGETLNIVELGATALALGGVAWVVMERMGQGGAGEGTRNYALGIALGLGAALCQAVTLITAKQGLGEGFPALSAVIIRMTVAMVLMWGWAALRGQVKHTIEALRHDRYAEKVIIGGAIAGPFVGVWLSLIAVQSERVGIASTLMALSPIGILPLVHWFFGEQVSRRAVGGTALAMVGVALIFLG